MYRDIRIEVGDINSYYIVWHFAELWCFLTAKKMSVILNIRCGYIPQLQQSNYYLPRGICRVSLR